MVKLRDAKAEVIRCRNIYLKNTTPENAEALRRARVRAVVCEVETLRGCDSSISDLYKDDLDIEEKVGYVDGHVKSLKSMMDGTVKEWKPIPTVPEIWVKDLRPKKKPTIMRKLLYLIVVVNLLVLILYLQVNKLNLEQM